VAGIVGFAASGYVMERLGQHSLYWMATIFALAAAGITAFMRRSEERSVIESKLSSLSPKGSSAD